MAAGRGQANYLFGTNHNVAHINAIVNHKWRSRISQKVSQGFQSPKGIIRSSIMQLFAFKL